MRKSDPSPQISRSLSAKFGAAASSARRSVLLEYEILRDHRSRHGAHTFANHDPPGEAGWQEALQREPA